MVLTVTDVAGNFSTCSATVTVGDNLAPTITYCPGNIVAPTTGFCASASWPPVTAKDNCTVASIVGNYNSGACFPLGTTTVKYTATDEKGNQSTCSFTVTANCSELFDPTKCYQIVNKKTGKALSVNLTTPAVFGIIAQSPLANVNYEKWSLAAVGGGYNKIVSLATGKVVTNQGLANNLLVYQYDYFIGGAEDWKLECLNNTGYYKITHRLTGKTLDGSLDAVGLSSLVTLQVANGGDAQQWRLAEGACSNVATLGSFSSTTVAGASVKTYSGVLGGEHDFALYPNPASQEVWLAIKGFDQSDLTLVVEDLTGRRIRQEVIGNAGSASYRLDVSDLATGVYLVKLISGGSAPVVKKLEIMK